MIFNHLGICGFSSFFFFSRKVPSIALLEHLSRSGPQDKSGVDWIALDDNTCHMLRNKLILDEHEKVPPLPNSMFCGRHPAAPYDLCEGLHGAPFSVKYNGSHWAAGIVSWRHSCTDESILYFTKVINYIDWIRETMQKNN